MPLLRESVHQGLAENVRMALETLRTNKLRSALTLLSISVAVTTLIAVVALLMGLDQSIQESIQSYGTNTALFSHLPSGPHFGRLSKEERQRKPLSYEDFLAVRESCNSCANVTVSLFNDQLNWARFKGEEVSGRVFLRLCQCGREARPGIHRDREPAPYACRGHRGGSRQGLVRRHESGRERHPDQRAAFRGARRLRKTERRPGRARQQRPSRCRALLDFSQDVSAGQKSNRARQRE